MSSFGPDHHAATCWACWEQTGTNSVLDSHNCSGFTDNGTGIIQINIAKNMANTNYASTGNSEISGHYTSQGINNNNGGQNTGYAAKFTARVDNGSRVDPNKAGSVVHGDLA